MKILVIDNYDSFVYNLVQQIGELGAEPLVFRNNELSLNQAKALNANGIVISPGPGSAVQKEYFGICTRILKSLSTKIPTLGICLGHQGIGYVFGAKIKRAEKIFHGKKSIVHHDGKGIFKGLPNPLTVGRYHSLVLARENLPKDLEVTATALEDNAIMGIRHNKYPIEGLQFHPESVLTKHGNKIINNFLRIVKENAERIDK